MSYEVRPNVANPHVGGTWHLAQGASLPADVWFKLAAGRDGQWVCTDVYLSAKRPVESGNMRLVPLTTTALRRIPLSQIIDRLINETQLEFLDRGGPLDLATGVRDFYDSPDEMEQPGARATYLPNGQPVAPTVERPKRGGRGPSVDELEKFAAAYKRALQTDRRHVIAETMIYLKQQGLVITRATANRWRDKCRDMSPPLLDPK